MEDERSNCIASVYNTINFPLLGLEMTPSCYFPVLDNIFGGLLLAAWMSVAPAVCFYISAFKKSVLLTSAFITDVGSGCLIVKLV